MKSKIKKKIGEKLANFLQRNFPEDFIIESLPKVFGDIKECREVKESDFQKVKRILLPLFEKNDTKEKKPVKTKTATEILDELGYKIVETKSKKEYAKFKRYYAKGEELCKFGSYDATSRYGRLFWFIKKNIDNIHRKDFDNPQRYDDYSTSIMSVAIASDGNNVAQICSRYNHTVNSCDNLYNSNLDNIAHGLTNAFNEEFNLNLGSGNAIELDSFYVCDKKYHWYSHEINGRKISGTCVDGVRYNPDTCVIFDYFLLDIKARKITSLLNECQDCFVNSIQELLDKGYPIEIRNGELNESDDDEGRIIIYRNK